MTSSGGQRFRRRALRRGYKVDEVDTFLDRVEATLGGDAPGTPVTAQEVHDVVFRVRFGGYDEWQVDLHLDRVERQLTELEERGGLYQRVEQRLAPQQVPPRVQPQGPPPVQAFDERPQAPFDERPPMPPQTGMPPQFDERPPQQPPVRDDRGFAPPPVREDYPTQNFPSVTQPPLPPVAAPPQSRSGEYPRPDPTSFNSGGYDAAGRHGRMEMTGEMGAVTGAFTPDEVSKVDALRRTFQPRRFGSGYDPAQVDRLFDAVMAYMTGRSGAAVADGELDPSQFSLVQGGYFEADVDSALKEIRSLLRK
ncbi:DivIVA domain-containing protein [Longispora sp. K20-0274]|uniref:DivIVA domain-containing protein n=1 Tax=Longispora sp. K20-0274 TaxID=3088255 RepID=UPI003999B282